MRCGLPAILLALGCAAQTAPEIDSKLREVGLTSTADFAAVELVETARKQLDEWAAAAAGRRRAGEVLAEDDPIVDGRADAEVERIRTEATASAESEELEEIFAVLADAHDERLAVLRHPKKFREKAYERADRRTTEVAFALRHWRARR